MSHRTVIGHVTESQALARNVKWHSEQRVLCSKSQRNDIRP